MVCYLDFSHTQFKQSGLSLSSPSAYLDNRTSATSLTALKTYIVSTISLLQPADNTSAYEEAAEGIIEFETGLAKVSQCI